MWDRIHLDPKKIGAFLVVALLTVIVGGTGLWGLASLSAGTMEIGTICLPSVDSLGTAATQQVLAQLALRDASRHAKDGRRAEAAQSLRVAEEHRRKLRKACDQYTGFPMTEREHSIWKTLDPHLRTWVAANKAACEAVGRNDIAAADAITFGRAAKTFEQSSAELDKLREAQGELGDGVVKEVAATNASARTTLILCMVISFVLAVALGLFLSVHVTTGM